MVFVTTPPTAGTNRSKETTVDNYDYDWKRGDRVQVKLTGHVVELVSETGSMNAATSMVSTASEPNMKIVRAVDVETRQIHTYMVDDLQHIA